MIDSFDFILHIASFTDKICSIFLFKIGVNNLFLEAIVARKIVITSGKGGVGKTTVTANLGTALAFAGQRVLMLDIDFGLNNLDVVLGLENKVIYDISDVIDGRCRIKQALIQDNYKKNLFLLPSSKIESSSFITGQNIKLIIENVSKMFDFVLIDCPAGIDIGFHRAVSCADEALVIATPNLTSIRDADKVISVLNSYKLNSVNIIINRARGDLIMSGNMMLPNDIKEVLKTDIIGVLPEEDVVFLSSGNLIPKRSDSYKAYKLLSNNILKNSKKLFDVTNKYSGFFGSIRRNIKRGI